MQAKWVVPFFAFLLLNPAAARETAKPKTAGKAVTEIVFAHQLAEAHAQRLTALVEHFNSQEPDLKITLNRAAPKSKPALLNLSTPDSIGDFLLQKSAFKPVSQLIQETGTKLPLNTLSADLLAGEKRNRLTALPVAFATPVLYYNKRIFRMAGLDPEAPPRTWPEVAQVAGRLIAQGHACPYTSSWPVWVHIDNVSAISGVPVANKKGNLEFNGLAQIRHIAMLASWHKSGYFHSFGRANEADEEFFRGNCVMLTSNSWAHSILRDAPGVELGVAPLPYYDDLRESARGHTLAAGAAIWIGGGYKRAEYRAAARFLRFLMNPATQEDIVRIGGFLPLTDGIRQSVRSKLQRDEEYALDVAYASLRGKGAAHPLRVSTLEPVRIIADEELEQVWAGKKPAKAALDIAVRRGNTVLSAKPALKRIMAY